ncbi:hypothetical protein BCR42DRAFT_487822 [Absidia repens]|uniref:RING-type E3 ubiquitin transferase BRCA1 n=1 Tax=Absidia repens TaxID=90262 RepID=A0A1X2ITW8_9FUNG|nr:hypothetical protein BCR42DRAFT_487822 [Absidia repens]
MTQQTTHDELPDNVEGLLLQMNQELTCPICLNLFTQCTSTPCGHIFCHQCIVHSLETLSKCPICKQVISKRSLYGSDSVEAIVQEFLVLRHQYEKNSGKVLTQLPIKVFQTTPQNDLSQLYPYPSKPNALNTTADQQDQNHRQTSNTLPTATQSLELKLEQPQQIEPSFVEQSYAAASNDESIPQRAAEQQQSDAPPTVKEHSLTAATIPASNIDSETHISLEQQQQNESSTLSLILFPPQSPLPLPQLQPESSSSNPPTVLPVQSPQPLATSHQHISSHMSKRKPVSPKPASSQLTSTQTLSSFEREPLTSKWSPNTVTDSSSTNHIMIYAVNQLGSTTETYLEELQNLGTMELAKEAHVSFKVTHFVFPAKDAQGIQNVSGAYLQALVLRKLIVHEYWIHECYQAKAAVDAVSFYTWYIGDGQAYYKDGPKRARESALSKEPPLFEKKVVYFHESVIGKLKKQFTNLMIAGGGQVIQNTQDMTSDTIILCQSLSKKKDDLLVAALHSLYAKPPISIVWMTQSILRYELLNEQGFIIGNSDSRKSYQCNRMGQPTYQRNPYHESKKSIDIRKTVTTYW